MSIRLQAVISVALVLFAVHQQIPARVSPNQLRNQIGKVATICGMVVTHHCPRQDKTTYLDLDTPYWDDGVSVAIPIADRPAFGLRVEDRYLQHSVCATGRL